MQGGAEGAEERVLALHTEECERSWTMAFSLLVTMPKVARNDFSADC